jgi:hypothetical protein
VIILSRINRLIGKKYGNLIIVRNDDKNCICRCACGNESEFALSIDYVKQGRGHCGCKDKNLIDRAVLYKLYVSEWKSIAHIASLLNIHRNTVSKYIDLYELRNRSINKELLYEKYIVQRKSIKDISSELSIPYNIVSKYIKLYKFNEEKVLRLRAPSRIKIRTPRPRVKIIKDSIRDKTKNVLEGLNMPFKEDYMSFDFAIIDGSVKFVIDSCDKSSSLIKSNNEYCLANDIPFLLIRNNTTRHIRNIVSRFISDINMQ